MDAEELKATNSDKSNTQLVSIVDRIVRLEEERANLSSDIKDIYVEAKSNGYTPRALRMVVRRRMEDEDKRKAREEVENEVEMMESALGAFANSPLGQAAIASKRH